MIHVLVCWLFTSLAAVVTFIRVLGRSMIIKQTGLDDVFMVIGTVAAVASSILVTISASYGLGKHEAAIEDADDLSQALKYSILSLSLYFVSSTCSKISILIFVVRLIGISAKRWHILCFWGLGVSLTVINLLTGILTVRFCDPFQKQWQRSMPGTCLPSNLLPDLGLVQGVYSALTDVVAAVFPVLFIAQLNMTYKTKFHLCLLMGGGCFAAATAIVKTYFVLDQTASPDLTFSWARITLAYTTEMGMIIITGTAPTLWALCKQMTRRQQGNKDSQLDAYNASGGYRCSSYPRDLTPSPPIGSATRVLREVDDMPTYGTWHGERADEESQSDCSTRCTSF
ncbi:hypothetical protein GGR50DRAFT_636034 [Xylaria sp. CBS 124048]|nr:hypothetical protein GGR50DRAFT_636034 [Xylaria sp. CBS 124048]